MTSFKFSLSPRRPLWTAISTALVLGASSQTVAATRTWVGTGTTANWSIGANWGGAVPANGDALLFQGAAKTSSANNITNLSVSGITFSPDAAAFSLSGNSLTSIGNITNSSNNLQTLLVPLVIGSDQTWDGGSKGLSYRGVLDFGKSALTLTNRTTLNNQNASTNVGDTGTASVTVRGASILSSTSVGLGGRLAGVGTVTITGAGSHWYNGNLISVGVDGRGMMNVENAGAVTSGALIIGNNSTSVGIATVTGEGSKLFSANGAFVGSNGRGTLNIENGGVVNSGSGTIGTNTKGVGTVTVSGRGSEWNSSVIQLGGLGTATLSIRDAGLVKASEVRIGSKGNLNLDGGTLRIGSALSDTTGIFNWVKGTLDITGARGATLGDGILSSTTTLASGQTLNVTNTLTVGSGKVLVLNGGEVNAKSTNLSNGTIRSTGLIDISRIGNISGSGSLDGAVTGGLGKTIAASGGNLKLGNVAARDAYAFAGNLEVGSRQVDLLSANQAQLGTTTNLATGGKLNTINGAYLGSGNTLAFSGNSSVAGNFTNNGNVVGSAGMLSFLNDVNGAGSYAGNVTFKAAFNPGNSPATVGFNSGNVTFDSGSVLNMEIFGNTPSAQYDQLVNINTLTFNGTLNLVFSNGYVPLAGSSFALFGFNTFNGSLTQDNITVTGYDRSRLDFSQLATNGSVSVTAVPEPETYAMLLAGLGLMGAIVRRRRANLSA